MPDSINDSLIPADREAVNSHKPLFEWANAETLQAFTTVIAGGSVFVGCWLYAVGSWGWFLGLAFGWLPSAILGAAAGWIAFRLWGLILGLAVLWILVLIYAFST